MYIFATVDGDVQLWVDQVLQVIFASDHDQQDAVQRVLNTGAWLSLLDAGDHILTYLNGQGESSS